MRSSLRKPLLATVASLLVAVLIAEFLVRASVGAPLAERLPILRILPHPTRGFRMVPNEDHYTYLHRVRVNSRGLRGPEVGPKRPDTVRILALGDSLTYGQGVADDETLPAYLEAFLNESSLHRGKAGRRFEVINAGHRSYDTRQEVALLQEFAREFEPDHVILFWFRDDLSPRDIEGNFRRISALPTPVAFDTGTRVEGWEALRWRLRELARRSALVMFVHDSLNRTPSRPLMDEIRTNQLARLDNELDLVQELGERIGFQSWFVPIPHRMSVREPELAMPLQDGALERARAKGLETCDLLPGLVQLYRETGRLPVLVYDGHYNADGNRIMAEVMAQALTAK